MKNLIEDPVDQHLIELANEVADNDATINDPVDAERELQKLMGGKPVAFSSEFDEMVLDRIREQAS